MSDDTTNRDARDRSRIALKERYEVDYWTQALNVSENQLREAVKAVGHGVDAVREYLR